MTHRAEGQRQVRRVVAASFIGTTIEYYDYTLFGLLAATVFNRLFFPQLNPTAGTLASFASFAAAFIVRPLGAALFGHFGDRIGRKATLILTLVIMGVGTIAIGLLPTYGAIGLWAPGLLVAARILQGLAVGGEWGGAVLIAVEHAPPERRGFYGAFPQAGIAAGLALASGVFLLVVEFSGESLLTWGWRIPFLASAVLLLIGLYIRLRVLESQEFRRVQESERLAAVPLAEILRDYKKSVLIGSGANAAPHISLGVATVFTLSYGPRAVGVSPSTVLGGIVVASLIAVPLYPLGAAISDRVGRIRLLMIGAVYTALIAFPFFWLFETANPLLIGLALVLIVPVAGAVTSAALASFLAELFDVRVRYTGAALSYQLAGTVMSGPAPFVATGLFAWAKGFWPIAVYIIVGCAVTMVALAAGVAQRRAVRAGRVESAAR